MDSLWFSVDDDYNQELDESSEESSAFLGVFNQSPDQIAKWLPRPQTPFSFHDNAFHHDFKADCQSVDAKAFAIPMSAPSISVF